ncbi:MAG: LysR family transcriptional regulator [Herbinix sp.]|nr:LysR family transcriptional regulator [Herbinix sp.]
MDLHYLELFNTIAAHSSFKKASEVLHISQPALSIQIKKLENQTSLKLFYKTNNKIYLSESGLLLYGYTKKIFSIVDEMEHNISSLNTTVGGTINLGGSNTPGTYILPAVIGEMKKRYPSVTINLHIANTSEITTLIDNGTLDVAVNGGNCNYNNYIYVEKLFDDRLVIIASPENKLCEKEYIDIEDLSEESFIVHEKTSQLYTCYKILIDEINIPKNISMFLGNIDAIKHAVNANLGISFIPYYAVKFEIQMGMLKELKLKSAAFDYPYNLVYNKNKNLSLTTNKFIEVLKDICRG